MKAFDTMRMIAVIALISLAGGVGAQQSDEEEYEGPSWRESRPEKPEIPDAPSMERPTFEFKVERPEFEMNDDFGGFKPKVAVQEVDDEPQDGESAEDYAADEAAVEEQPAPAVVETAPPAREPEPVVEEPAEVIADVAEQGPADSEPTTPAPVEATEDAAIAATRTDESDSDTTAEAEPAQLAAVTPPATESTQPLSQAPRRNSSTSLTPTRMVQPDYPAEAWRDRQEGWVDVQLQITSDGRVTDARALRAQPRRVFDRSAVRAALQWEFDPVDGLSPSETVTKTYRISFTMGEDNGP